MRAGICKVGIQARPQLPLYSRYLLNQAMRSTRAQGSSQTSRWAAGQGHQKTTALSAQQDIRQWRWLCGGGAMVWFCCGKKLQAFSRSCAWQLPLWMWSFAKEIPGAVHVHRQAASFTLGETNSYSK